MHTFYRPFTIRVSALSRCSSDTLRQIENAQGRLEARRAGSEICIAGTEVRRAFSVISGWALRTRHVADGRRQVLGFALPGDTINFALHADAVVPCTIECLTDVTLADIEPLRRQVTNGRSADAVSVAVRSTLAMDEAVALASIARLVRQSAYERLALLLLELQHRLAAVSPADARSLQLPLTQQVLSDSLGLSVVHVNRTLMQLRREGYVDRRQRTLVVTEPEALAARVHFIAPSLRGAPPAEPLPNAAQPMRAAC